MFNLFKKAVDNSSVKVSQDVDFEGIKIEEQNKIVQEIHDAFYGEVDNLLKTTEGYDTLTEEKQRLFDKCERLQSLGFWQSKEVAEVRSEMLLNDRKRELAETIRYFSHKYPQYKFITEASVKNICKKYGLVYGDVNKYKGEVPEENLKHIEDFKVDENDECYFFEEETYTPYSEPSKYVMNFSKSNLDSFIDKKGLVEDPETNGFGFLKRKVEVEGESKNFFKGKCRLEIVAPVDDFDVNKSDVKDFSISHIPDPIVLKPVIYDGMKHYLIVTAWGLEASDDLVVNERFN